MSGGAPKQSEFESAEISAFKTLKIRSQAITQRSNSMGSIYGTYDAGVTSSKTNLSVMRANLIRESKGSLGNSATGIERKKL